MGARIRICSICGVDHPMGTRCSLAFRDHRAGGGTPTIENFDEARTWIQVLHRRSCRDLDHIERLEREIAWLERPWYRRLFSRRP